ncbi:Uncharacterised protein [Scardovia inopinata]|uniref:YdbS-like PH domain-containing protein n=2 Tax=Scardovia inopinata TaxID=78259 RepID=W5IHV1_SCAIO|nr:PH domain-containing protein [Scardovia inopinata]EFG26441.2 hypothetical protein HMPREF9020_00060 [Scardovia inopinata F0304]BAR07482.1 hypothetical protein SCIP_1415 [Scardovia inopinata JCM 12537]SUV51555.1 Uncharacterised protein [Scardovia inopinata]
MHTSIISKTAMNNERKKTDSSNTVYTFRPPKNAILREEIITIGTAIIAIALLSIAVFLNNSLVTKRICYALIIFICLASPCDLLFFIPRRIRTTVISLNSKALTLKEGKLLIRTKIIPIARITMLSQTNDPIASFFQQSRIKITATTEEMHLPYLSHEDVSKLLDLLQRFASIKDNE